jgi:hypothetical protein
MMEYEIEHIQSRFKELDEVEISMDGAMSFVKSSIPKIIGLFALYGS